MSKDSAEDKGIQEQAGSEGSNSQSGQQGSSTAGITEEQFLSLKQTIDSLARTLQSDKDRAVKRTNQKVDGLIEDVQGVKQILQSALNDGKNISDVLKTIEEGEEIETRQMLREMAIAFREGRVPGAGSGGTEQAKGVDVTAVIKELELNENDPRVQVFRSKAFSNEAEAYKEASKLLKVISTTQPTDADLPSEVTKSRFPAEKQVELRKEYEEGSKNLRGRDLVNYKMEMRKKGLDIS